MHSKIIGKSSRIPDAFDSSSYETERACCAKIAEWINQIIRENHLDFGPAEVDTIGTDKKYPDLIIHATPRKTGKIACVMEFKLPYFDPFHEEELKEPARKKANKRESPYFVTSNFQDLIWWNTEQANKPISVHEQIVHRYTLSQIEDLNQIDEFRYKESIKKALERFVLKLYAIYTKKEPEPKQAIDEILIYLLQKKIQCLARLYRDIIESASHKDVEFSKNLQRWFIEQGWSFAWQPQDFDKVARQTAYLLVNKILFYDLLQAKRPQQLDPLEIPKGLTKGAILQKTLQAYFEQVVKEIDYETIYTTDFIDTVAFKDVNDVKEVVIEVKSLIRLLDYYDFSQIGYDIIGRIFERLIPQDERHNLGQYFTNADVVDLILRFCLHNENEKVLDPACGAGTFLVRAYQHKKLMNMRKPHTDILDTLWGNDIAKFPAHLATINLAINDLSVDKNYPNIIKEDFFALRVGSDGFDPVNYRKVRAKTLGVAEREVIYPRWFDVIVGNPPYTRQEEIPAIGVNKEKLIENALLDPKHKKLAEISKRAGIHAYFFVHGAKFLKDGGYFGFIVSNSWLDVEYGKGLQEFFLKNYKIVAIIESKVERWFEQADVNTCIIILKKCKEKKERDENLVRFVYLKKPLRYFIPPAQDIWEKQVGRINEIDKLIKTILGHNEFYETEEYRIFPKSQKELWDEGYNSDDNEYVGSKWGKYLRAPEIFFKILEKGKGKFVPLKDIADVRRGYIPWPYDVFRLTKDEIVKLKISGEYLKETISSPSESSRIVIDELIKLPYYLLFVDKPFSKIKDDNLKKYLKSAAGTIDRARTNPDEWFCLQKREVGPIVWPRTPYNRHVVFFNKKGVTVIDHIEITPKKENAELICGILNSSVYILFREVFGRTGLGGGTLKNEVIDLKVFPIPEIKRNTTKKQVIDQFEQLVKREPQDVFEEFGSNSSEDVLLDTIKPDRRELDKIIMGEILGLTDEEQLEVYQAVVDLVKSRIEKAKSVDLKHKTKEGIDIDMFLKNVMDKIGSETIGKFYKEKILSQKELSTRTIPQPVENVAVKKGLFGWGVHFGKKHISCDSEREAEYIKIIIETGVEKVKIPREQKYLNEILPELESLKKKIDKTIYEYLSSIFDRKLREKLLFYIWQEVMK